MVGDRKLLELQAEVRAELRLGGQAVHLHLVIAEQRDDDVCALLLPIDEFVAEEFVGRRFRRDGQSAQRSITNPER
ncbi:MAG: hypothetical protein ACYTBR_10275 [Planctomycetota bacterium]